MVINLPLLNFVSCWVPCVYMETWQCQERQPFSLLCKFTPNYLKVYVVVNFLSHVIFVFLLFLGKAMYANEVGTKEKLTTTYILGFNSILGLNFIFFSFKLIIIHYHDPKQRQIIFKPRIKLNHNIYIHLSTKHVHPHINEIMGHSISLW